MLITNLVTEFKDSNGTLRIHWNLMISQQGTRSVYGVPYAWISLFDDETFRPLGSCDTISSRLLAWAAPQTIEQLKAKLAF